VIVSPEYFNILIIIRVGTIIREIKTNLMVMKLLKYSRFLELSLAISRVIKVLSPKSVKIPKMLMREIPKVRIPKVLGPKYRAIYIVYKKTNR